jgi:hypothetical protein
MVPPHNQNMMRVSNQIKLLILYYTCISSKVEVIDFLIFFYLIVVSSLLILAFKHFF